MANPQSTTPISDVAEARNRNHEFLYDKFEHAYHAYLVAEAALQNPDISDERRVEAVEPASNALWALIQTRAVAQNQILHKVEILEQHVLDGAELYDDGRAFALIASIKRDL